MTADEATTASALTSDRTHLPATSLSRVTAKTRERAAERGQAMSDGSFPIRDGADLRRAVKAFGRAKDKAAAKRHIIRRAKALNKVHLLPDSWKELATREFPGNRPTTIEASAFEDALVAAMRAPVDEHDPNPILTAKAEKSGVPVAKLKVVYNRGLTAAATSSRTCVSNEQLAHARVNAYLLALKNLGSTQDADLLPGPPPFN